MFSQIHLVYICQQDQKTIHKGLRQATLMNASVQYYTEIINTFNFNSHKCKSKP